MGKLLLTLKKHPRALCPPALGMLDCSETHVPCSTARPPGWSFEKTSSATRWAYLPIMSAGRNVLHMLIIES